MVFPQPWPEDISGLAGGSLTWSAILVLVNKDHKNVNVLLNVVTIFPNFR